MLKYLPEMKSAIRETTTDWRERAFAFNTERATPIQIGDCDDIPKPEIEKGLGTFHTHTIDFSRPSPEDIDILRQSNDKMMCYARPVDDDLWNLQCMDKEQTVCAEEEYKI